MAAARGCGRDNGQPDRPGRRRKPHSGRGKSPKVFRRISLILTTTTIGEMPLEWRAYLEQLYAGALRT